MTDIQIPLAWHPVHGDVTPVAPELDADHNATPRRQRAACHKNKHPLILRRGRQKVAHFAHRSPAPANVEGRLETAIHRLAKRDLAAFRGDVKLPAWLGYTFAVRIVEGRAEVTLPNKRRPDVLWQAAAGERIAAEARYGNAKDMAYASEAGAPQLPTIELDVRGGYAPETSPQLAELIATAAWVAVPSGPFHQEDAPKTPLEPRSLSEEWLTDAVWARM